MFTVQWKKSSSLQGNFPRKHSINTFYQAPVICITMATIKIKYYKRRTQTTHSAERVASNDDLLTEILLRLPVKSLLQFKTISKHWLSLITSPHFSLLRYPNPIKPSGLFLQVTPPYHRPEYDYIPFDGKMPCHPPFRALTFTQDYHGIRILQSCNGLLFCCSSRWPERCRKYYVYNPTTKQFTIIPPLPGKIQKTNIHSMVLAFDPSKSPHYKVICVRNSVKVRDVNYQILIYSSEAGPWRVSGQPFSAASINFRSGTYLNGAVHWTSNSDITRYFKIDEEQLETMPMPLPQFLNRRISSSIVYFGESRGCLYHSENYSRYNTQFDVYEMEKNYSRWYVKYHVDLNGLFDLFSGPSRIYLPTVGWKNAQVELLRIVRGEREEDSFLVLVFGGKVFKYNLVEKTFKKLYDIPTSQCCFGGYGLPNAFAFIESLSTV